MRLGKNVQCHHHYYYYYFFFASIYNYLFYLHWSHVCPFCVLAHLLALLSVETQTRLLRGEANTFADPGGRARGWEQGLCWDIVEASRLQNRVWRIPFSVFKRLWNPSGRLGAASLRACPAVCSLCLGHAAVTDPPFTSPAFSHPRTPPSSLRSECVLLDPTSSSFLFYSLTWL